jgi:hypothetical protein
MVTIFLLSVASEYIVPISRLQSEPMLYWTYFLCIFNDFNNKEISIINYSIIYKQHGHLADLPLSQAPHNSS